LGDILQVISDLRADSDLEHVLQCSLNVPQIDAAGLPLLAKVALMLLGVEEANPMAVRIPGVEETDLVSVRVLDAEEANPGAVGQQGLGEVISDL
jgi:hypothetical protein